MSKTGIMERLRRNAAVPWFVKHAEPYRSVPPEQDSPFPRLDNVVTTPHNAALAVGCMRRMAIQAAMAVEDVLSRRTPKWPVSAP